MKYENRWSAQQDKIHSHYTSSASQTQYRKDDTIGKPIEGSILQATVATLALVSGGTFLYKKGAFKPIVETIISTLDNYKGYTPEMMGVLKRWTTNSKDSPVKSIFRKNTQENVIQRFKGIAKAPDKYYRDTLKDMNNLKESFAKRMKEVKLGEAKHVHESMRHTDIMMAFTSSEKMFRNTSEISLNVAKLQHRVNADIIKNNTSQIFVDGLMKHSDEVKKQIKRSGFRQLTLGEVAIKTVKDSRKSLIKKGNSPISQKFLDEISEFIRTREITKNGQVTKMIDNDNIWANMKIDSNILINEKGKIIDIRRIRRYSEEFINSLTNDFAIPLIHLNPLKLFGIDEMISKPTRYGLIRKGLKNPMLTGVRGIGKNSELAQDFFFMNGKIMHFKGNDLIEVGDNFRLSKVNLNNEYGLNRRNDIVRKMGGISNAEFDRYVKDDGFVKYHYGKIMESLGIGFQDADNIGHVKLTDPMSYGNLIGKLIQKSKPYKFKQTFKASHVFGAPKHIDDDIFIAYRRYTKLTPKLKEAIASDKSIAESISVFKQWGKQFVAGQKDLENVTTATMSVYHLFERLSSALSGMNLSLATKDIGDTKSVFKNLMLKRVLPVYAGIEGWRYLNYDMEERFGVQPEDAIADVVIATDYAWHEFKDTIGLTAVAKRLEPLMPGGEQISGIPGLGVTNMSDTYDERKNFWESGEVAIRKGRFWSLGNTPFTGGKVSYFAPNWYRRVKSDYEYTDAKWGSREEYHDNSWIPTLRHPLAPVKKFLTDPYHWDIKHYKDRPYMLTAPALTNTPILGPIIGSTIGKVIKPQRKMHPEYWSKPYNGEASVDILDGGAGTIYGGPHNDDEYNSKNNIVFNNTIRNYNSSNSNSHINIKKVPQVKSAMFERSWRKGLIETSKGTNIEDINNSIKRQGLNYTQKTKPSYVNEAQKLLFPSDIKTMNGISETIESQYHALSEMAGIYGFSLDSVLNLENQDKDTVIEDSSYAYSLNKQFWDKDIGGLGGELSEIYRRFFAKRRKDVKYYNPIKNTQPHWIPGEDYFIDFKHGDPFSKIARGEMRLPSKGYERLYGISDPTFLGIGSSLLGKSVSDMVKHLMNEDTITDEKLQDIVDEGAKIHSQIQKQWKAEGYLIDDEVKIEDVKNNIVGYYDARVWDEGSKNNQAIAEIKTISDKKYDSLKKAKDAHVKQLNFYLHHTGMDKGYIYYYRRGKDSQGEYKRYEVKYNKKLYKESIKNLETARSIVKTNLAEGKINRGDLYNYFDRYRILADVAPYSKEFREYNTILSHMDLNEKERKELSEIRKQVSIKKEPLRIYNYRFKTANLKKQHVTIKKIIDHDTYLTYEMGNTPIKLAGVNVKQGDERAKLFVNNELKAGTKVEVGYDADVLNVIEDDTYHSVKVVMYKNGKNLNKFFIGSGMGNEKENDFSPAGVNARFTGSQIAFGKAWESVAHFHSFTNTKFLQVRSGLESYKRRDIYGKDFQKWSSPIRDYLKPTIEQRIDSKFSPLWGIFIGSWFGARRSLYGALVGAIIGGATMTVGDMYKQAYESTKNERWIPKRRREERELNEYIDMLKYIKNKRLYTKYLDKANKEDNFDVKAYQQQVDNSKDYVKKRRNILNSIKKRVKFSNDNIFSAKNALGKFKLKIKPKSWKKEDLLHAINEEIESLTSESNNNNLPINALKALEYYKAAEETLYGYDSGESIQNILKALPKRERRYFKHFLEAPEEERIEILELAPKYMRRPLESAWGLPVEEKTNLIEYFTKHQLPDSKWKGWAEDIPLDAVKVKLVRKEARDIYEYDIWPSSVEKADELGEIPLPYINKKESRKDTINRLREVLTALGLKDVDIQYTISKGSVDVDMNLSYDRRKEIERYINHKGSELFS